jgi:hypothetical protein
MLINTNDYIFNKHSGRILKRILFKYFPYIIHKVIYIGKNIYDQQEYVVDFNMFTNLRVLKFQDFEKFKASFDCNFDDKLKKDGFLPIIERLNKFDINKKYNLFNYNCHNFVDEMSGFKIYTMKKILLESFIFCSVILINNILILILTLSII